MKRGKKDDEAEDYTTPDVEPLDDSKLGKAEQITLAEQIQAMTLRLFFDRIKNRTISDTGLATITRLLVSQGWELDPNGLPKDPKDMLTSKHRAEDLDDDDVIPFPGRKQA
jgi:hypothetical protein